MHFVKGNESNFVWITASGYKDKLKLYKKLKRDKILPCVIKLAKTELL